MDRLHTYKAVTTWVGNRGTGTSSYAAYDRNHNISIPGKPDLLCSSDPLFRGDQTRHNPEELLVAALSGCHMLWFLHLCAANGVVVTEYVDEAVATMQENADGSGQFIEVILSPVVTVQDDSMIGKVEALHEQANAMCFIARSVSFPVRHKPSTRVSPALSRAWKNSTT